MDYESQHLDHALELVLVLCLLLGRSVGDAAVEGVLPVHHRHVLPHQDAQPAFPQHFSLAVSNLSCVGFKTTTQLGEKPQLLLCCTMVCTAAALQASVKLVTATARRSSAHLLLKSTRLGAQSCTLSGAAQKSSLQDGHRELLQDRGQASGDMHLSAHEYHLSGSTLMCLRRVVKPVLMATCMS